MVVRAPAATAESALSLNPTITRWHPNSPGCRGPGFGIWATCLYMCYLLYFEEGHMWMSSSDVSTPVPVNIFRYSRYLTVPTPNVHMCPSCGLFSCRLSKIYIESGCLEYP